MMNPESGQKKLNDSKTDGKHNQCYDCDTPISQDRWQCTQCRLHAARECIWFEMGFNPDGQTPFD